MAKLKILGREDTPEQPEDAPDQRKIVGTIDQMLVFNDPATQCQRSIKINGYMYSDDQTADVNMRADIAHDVLERQFLRHDLKRLYRDREDQIMNMTKHLEFIEGLQARREARAKGSRGVANLTTMENDKLDKNEQTMKTAKEILAKIDRDIASHKEKCGLTK